MTPNTPMTELSEKVDEIAARLKSASINDRRYERPMTWEEADMLVAALSQSLRAPAGEAVSADERIVAHAMRLCAKIEALWGYVDFRGNHAKEARAAWTSFCDEKAELLSLSTAALASPPSEGVKVKPLVWRPIGPVGSDVEAETPIGTYTMSFDAPTAGGATNLWMAGADADTFEVHERRRDAEAAAFAHFSAAIRSSLEPTP